MEEGTVVPLPKPGATLADDPLLAVLREGARRMRMQAVEAEAVEAEAVEAEAVEAEVVEAEVEAFLAAHADLTDNRGRRRLVRNGHGPERHLQTGIGPVGVSRPRVRDRGGNGSGPIRFSSAILPMIGAADHPAKDQERRGAVALALPEGRLDWSVR